MREFGQSSAEKSMVEQNSVPDRYYDSTQPPSCGSRQSLRKVFWNAFQRQISTFPVKLMTFTIATIHASVGGLRTYVISA